jgi:hypothetical protein
MLLQRLKLCVQLVGCPQIISIEKRHIFTRAMMQAAIASGLCSGMVALDHLDARVRDDADDFERVVLGAIINHDNLEISEGLI